MKIGVVVGLVDYVVDNVLVVVDGFGFGCESISLFWFFEVVDVLDEGDREVICSRVGVIDFIEFVVYDKEFLVVGVKNLVLVSV